jgi:hypothetical protein
LEKSRSGFQRYLIRLREPLHAIIALPEFVGVVKIRKVAYGPSEGSLLSIERLMICVLILSPMFALALQRDHVA